MHFLLRLNFHKIVKYYTISVMYKFMSAGEEATLVKKVVQNEYISKSDLKYRKIYLKACNPPDNIVRGTEGIIIQL